MIGLTMHSHVMASIKLDGMSENESLDAVGVSAEFVEVVVLDVFLDTDVSC